MRVFKARAALGSVAVALLTLAIMAPTAMAAPGNGGGNGQGHGKPADTGSSRASGHEAKPDKKVKPDKKEKPDKKAKPEKGSKAGAKALAMAPCKNGGWQTLQSSDGTPFTNQGRCVSYAVHGGVLVPLVTEDEPVEPVEDPAALPEQGGANYLAMLPCKDGGWQTLQRADGTRFSNQGRCVSYAVHGGALAAVVPVVTISFVPSLLVVGSCDATAVLGDFDPTTEYELAWTVDGFDGGVSLITTDALGDASLTLGSFESGDLLALTVDGAPYGEFTVACPPEVEAPQP